MTYKTSPHLLVQTAVCIHRPSACRQRDTDTGFRLRLSFRLEYYDETIARSIILFSVRGSDVIRFFLAQIALQNPYG